MHSTLKEKETQLVKLKEAVTLLSMKKDLLSTRGNKVVQPKPKIVLNPWKSDKGKWTPFQSNL